MTAPDVYLLPVTFPTAFSTPSTAPLTAFPAPSTISLAASPKSSAPFFAPSVISVFDEADGDAVGEGDGFLLSLFLPQEVREIERADTSINNFISFIL